MGRDSKKFYQVFVPERGKWKDKRDRELAALDLVNGRVEEKEGEKASTFTTIKHSKTSLQDYPTHFPESQGTNRKIKRWSNTATRPLPSRNRWN